MLTLVGYINIPIIKFSVDWWNTLHQPASVMRMDGPAMPPSMLTPLLTMALAFTLLFVTLHMVAMRSEILRRRIRALRQREAAGAAGVATATQVTREAPSTASETEQAEAQS